MGQRRFQSSTSTTFLHKHKAETLKRNWFSDPSTYPLMGVMVSAAFLVVGVGASCLAYNPDVQINPNKRGAIMRTWEM